MNKNTRIRHMAETPVGRDVDRRSFLKLTGAGLVAALPISTALRENLDAVRVHLTPTDLREMETALSRIEIYGGRMDARQMAQIGQDGE